MEDKEEPLCKCDHVLSEHCRDDECCWFDYDKHGHGGGYCFAGCGCNEFEDQTQELKST